MTGKRAIPGAATTTSAVTRAPSSKSTAKPSSSCSIAVTSVARGSMPVRPQNQSA
jgi:hypothetical protein